MSDVDAIRDLTIEYCWALDEKAFERLDVLFIPEATADLGGAYCGGLLAIKARCRSALDHLDVSHHMVSNHQIRVDGDTASARCYVHAQHVKRGVEGGSKFVVAGRYVDRVVLTDAGWRIAHRDLVVMWTDGNRLVARHRDGGDGDPATPLPSDR